MKNFRLEASEMLQRSELKLVLGGYDDEGDGLAIRNVAGTGNFITYNGGVTSCECTWQANSGSGWDNVTGPCPTSHEYSCIA